MPNLAQLIAFLAARRCALATAESCTCGLMASMLADQPGCGQVLDSGFVVYSVAAKTRLLGVREETIETFGLTSEQVAREMALGALAASDARLAVANTGVADGAGEDPVGTQCYAYALAMDGGAPPAVLTETVRFAGERVEIRQQAAEYGLGRLIEQCLALERLLGR